MVSHENSVMDVMRTDLADRLETVAHKALDWCEKVLALPIDSEDMGLIRAQASAATTALHTQAKANALMFQKERADHALAALIAEIRKQSALVPIGHHSESRFPFMGSLALSQA